MAASILLQKQKSKKEIIDCGICSKTVEDPRMLECFHTFCLKCLTSYGENKTAGDGINCPVCKKEFNIPPGGIDDVPVNHFVSKLIRFDKNPDKELGEASTKRICEECLILDQKEPATEYCVDCSENMCNNCIRKHNKNKFFVTHKKYSLDKKPRADELLKMTVNNCQNHHNNPIEAYCSDCRTTLCTTCMHTGGHKEHNCMDIKTAAAELSKKTYEDAAKWSCFMKETNEIVKLSDSAMQELAEQIETARSGIKNRYDEMKVLLERNYKELNENLDSIESERKRELERMRDEGKQEMLMLESLERHWNEVKARGSDCDVVQAAISLQNKSEQVAKQHEEKIKEGMKDKFVDKLHTIDYVPSDTFTIGSGMNLLGAIEERCAKKAVLCPDWNRLLNSCKVQSFASEGSCLYGITIHNNEVYMTSFGTPHILVYSLQNLSTVSRQISVPGLTKAIGLVYNESDSYLYACNQISGYIYKINTRDDSVTGWAIQTNEPWDLSISKQKNLLVSYYDCGQIDEFNGSGQLIRSIKLTDGITGIYHSIELETGDFIVCQWNPLNRICLVDSSGKVIKSYGKECGSGVGQLNQPEHIELDQRGNILVSDYGNNKLRVLTSDLKHVADVSVTDSGFYGPVSCYWDKENDRLLLATWSDRFYTIIPQC